MDGYYSCTQKNLSINKCFLCSWNIKFKAIVDIIVNTIVMHALQYPMLCILLWFIFLNKGLGLYVVVFQSDIRTIIFMAIFSTLLAMKSWTNLCLSEFPRTCVDFSSSLNLNVDVSMALIKASLHTSLPQIMLPIHSTSVKIRNEIGFPPLLVRNLDKPTFAPSSFVLG